jgi:hypothetical protein
MAELMKVRALQEKVVDRMLDRSVEKDDPPMGPRLRVVK